ncbi:MAG TPA: type I phosphomannose isomerase catalytic subunit [Anaerovoracaceae bacterium]|nr:type I phosphomannose isomerase catalytic subunit [Anaerovoracaceae bacterium]
MLYPIKLKPIFKNYIWGGRNLEKLGVILPMGKTAEVWEVSCHPDGISLISNGMYKGLSLIDYISVMGKDAVGTDHYNSKNFTFPLLLKLIDASEKLSVQVHPDDDYANNHESGESGKHEAWYIIDAKPGAQIIYNVIPGIDKEDFVESVNKSEIDQCLNYMNVFAGDVIDIYPGMIHSIGAGIVLAEIQQNSNLTYRLYDYDRMDKKGNKRALNIKKALEVMDFVPNDRKEKAIGIDLQINAGSHKSFKLANKCFSLEVYWVSGEIEEHTDGSKFYIYLILEGDAIVKYLNGRISVKAGESIFMPASMGKYTLKGDFKALKMYVPDIQLDIIAPLTGAGHSLKEIYMDVCS